MRTACTRWFADIIGAQPAKPTGWCSWQGLVTLPDIADKHVALMIIGEHGNLGLWPAGGSDVQWWFDLPWSPDFVRPERPIEMIRSNFTGWSDSVDRVLATLTDDDLARSPFPHFRHPIPRPGPGRGHVARRCRTHDAAHACAGDQSGAARHDGVVQGAFGFRNWQRHGSNGDLSSALRWYENTRRRKVKAVSWVTTLQVSRSESVLRPAALISDRFMTWALTMFLRSVSHRRISAEVSRDLAAVAASWPSRR